MVTEEKKYLVNIESNLDKYAKEADEARKKVDELTVANLKMTEETPRDEVEKNNSALRNAQKEYRDAKKMVDLQTAANRSELGSRKQLGEILTLQMRELGKLGGAYIKNAEGLDVLNPKYVEQRNRIAETKQAIIEYDKALGDGRSSVGLYSEAISSSLSDVGKKIMAVIGPAGLIAAGAAVAKKVFDGLTEAIKSTTFAINAMNIAGAVTKQLFFDIAINGNISLENLKSVIGATEKFNALRVQQYDVDYKLGKIQREINGLMLEASDITKSDAERLELYNKVRELDTEQTVKETDAIKARIVATNELLQVRKGDETLLKELYSLAGQLDDAYAKSDQAMRRVASQQSGILNRQREERVNALAEIFQAGQDEIDNAEKKKETDAKELQQLKDKNTKEIGALVELVDKKILLKKRTEDVDLKHLKHNDNVEKQIEAGLRDQMKADALATDTWIQNRDRAADALGALSNIIGAETEAGKVFAAAQATINTWTAASMTLRDPTIPSTFARIATMATVILTGLNTVKNIMKVNTSGSAPSVSTPTSIVVSPTAQRAFATPLASSFITQPQLTQPQLNAAPSNLLTAEDIAMAISKLPNPVVSVEAIDNVTRGKRKVEARARI